jgi:hypothetical protein
MPISNRTISVTVFDVDQNGAPDAIFASMGYENSLLSNDGNGGFTLAELPGGKLLTTSTAVGDLDDDGYFDIVFGNTNAEFDQILWSPEGGLFYAANLLSNHSTEYVVLGDMDNNGYLDIVFGKRGPNILHVHDGVNYVPTSLPGGIQDTRSIAVADMNKDGLLDVLVGNCNSPSQLLLNNGSYNFIVQNLTVDSCVYDIKIADFDRDGHTDVAFGISEYSARDVILFNDGNATFDVQELPGAGATWGLDMDIGDLDSNGYIDLVVVEDGAYHLIMNYGGRNFTSYRFDMDEGFARFALGDMNLDGRIDMVFANYNGAGRILYNEGS